MGPLVLKIVQYCALPYIPIELSSCGSKYRFTLTATRTTVTFASGVLVFLSAVPPLLAIIYDLNALDLTKWISLLELLLEWFCALMAHFVFLHHRAQTANLLNETINMSERTLLKNEAQSNFLRTVASRWLIRLAIIVLFHLLLVSSITDAIPEQWSNDPLHSLSYRFSLFCSSFILCTFVRTLELYMLSVDHIKCSLHQNLNDRMMKINQRHDYHGIIQMVQADAELNGLVFATINHQNAVITFVLFSHFFGTVSDSYELFVGLKAVHDAVRRNHALDGTKLLHSGLRLLLRCTNIYSMIYGFNKFHQTQIHTAFSICQSIPAADHSGINYGRLHEIVTMHMMPKISSVDISHVISLNNSLLFKILGATLGFIVLLMQIKLSEEL